jgi:hypothetical protein
VILVINCGGYVFNVKVDGVAVSQKLDDGGQKNEEAQLFVPEDLNEFFPDKVAETAKHGRHPILC